MVLICLWHYNPGHFISSGYLGVEFFFLLSGYLMYSAIKKKTPVMDYLKKRYSQLLGKYLLVLILMHIIKGCIAAYGGTFSFIDALTSLLPECLLLQNIGVFHSTGYLFPTWYLSVLIYGGTFILLLHNNLGSKWGGVISALIVIGTYTYLIRDFGSIECWNTIGCFYIPFWRGVAAMTIGVYIHRYIDILNIQYNAIGAIGTILATVFTILITITQKGLDEYVLLLLVCIVTNLFTSVYSTSMSQKLSVIHLSYCGELTYEMFLLHPFVIIFCNTMNLESRIGAVGASFTYLIVILLLSIAYKYFYERIISKLTNRQK